MTDQATPDPDSECERPVSACSGELGGLLARWCDLAPAECRQITTAVYRLEAVKMLVNPYGTHGATGVLAAVVWHVAERDLLAFRLGVAGGRQPGGSTWDEASAEIVGKAWEVTPYDDPSEALMALASSALSAYLNALEAA